MGLADCLSRLSIHETGDEDECLDEDLMVCFIDTLAGTNFDKIANATLEDSTLQAVKHYVLHGWPEHRAQVNADASAYWDVREELATYHGIVFRGERVCIPEVLKKEMLSYTHSAHLGMVKTKQFARDIIYWPGMAKQIEEMIGKCEICLQNQNKQTKEPLRIHPLPSRPFQKVGCDLFQWNNNHYLVLVDYYSGFIEVEPLIDKIKTQIARYGIMDMLVTDGGTQFTSHEFREFRKLYGFHHNVSSPEHQQANGLAENAVKQMKALLTKVEEDGGDFYLALLLLRNSPRDGVLGSPVQRFMSRRTRTNMPTAVELLQPKVLDPEIVRDRLSETRLEQKYYYDKNAKVLPEIRSGDAVRIRTQSGWQPATYVSKDQMPNSHVVRAGDQARLYRRNRRDLLRTNEQPHVVQPQRIQTYPRVRPPDPQVTRPNDAIPIAKPVRSDVGQLPTIGEPQRQGPRPSTRLATGKHISQPKWLKDFST
jgi:hypothetical protein